MNTFRVHPAICMEKKKRVESCRLFTDTWNWNWVKSRALYSDHLLIGKIVGFRAAPPLINLWTSWQSPGTPAFPGQKEMLNPLSRNFSGPMGNCEEFMRQTFITSLCSGFRASVCSFSNATQAYLLSMWLTQLSKALELETVPTSIQYHPMPLQAKWDFQHCFQQIQILWISFSSVPISCFQLPVSKRVHQAPFIWPWGSNKAMRKKWNGEECFWSDRWHHG